MSGRVLETYAAALQHGLSDVGDATLVGVVRRPPGWFSETVDENIVALGPPGDLLDETERVETDFKMAGMCEEGAHNAAWEDVNFADRYRAYLDDSSDAATALAGLVARVEDGEDVALVCFEGDAKRCHRQLLKARLEDRLDA